MVSTSSPLKAGQVAETITAPTRVRWTVVALAAFVTGLTYVDRLNLGIVAKNFQEEFQFTTQTMGWVLGAFSLGYAWFHLPGGWLADRFGARRVLAGAIIWFSAFTALTTVAPRLPLLNLLGAAWAFAERSNGTTTLKLTFRPILKIPGCTPAGTVVLSKYFSLLMFDW